jgi:predicted amidohydrolase YtcJ
VVAAGSAAEVRARVGAAREAVELGHRAVLPGFQDAHCHPLHGGLQARRCDMGEARTAQACQAAVVRFLEANPEAEWVTGGGWSMETFPGGTPPAGTLDEVCGGRPAFLVNRDGHSAWVSSRALELAGIDAATADPRDGRIEREPTGRPQGTLHEGAMDIVRRLVPDPTPEELTSALEQAQAHLIGLGVTAWQDAAVDHETQAAYECLAADGRLRARTRLALWWDRGRGLDQVDELVERRDRLRGLGLCAGTVKVMLDGVMETYTAALLEPYTDPGAGAHEGPGGCRHDLGTGKLFLEPELVDAALAMLAAHGFQVHFHAIGDRAVRVALDAVEHAGDGRSLRHHVAHIQLVHPDDVARFHRLGVVANAQPFWACVEPQMTELTIPFLGPTRSAWQYPFASLADTGAVLAAGSDWPVSTANPLEEIAVAVSRVLPESARDGAAPDEPFLPAERLGLSSAFSAFTAGSAFVNHLEEETGTIEEGKLADLVVLEHDPFTTGVDRLPEASVALTVIGGEVVFDAERV